MGVIIKGNNAFDMSIVSNIKNVESPYIKFQNIYFKCKSIEDAGGTIFVKRKKGTWIKTGQSFVFPEKFRNYSCSECGYDVDKIKFNFCPNCGAHMRGEQG